MADDNDIRWGLAQRFEFIEWRVYWVGRVNRKDLEDQFQISTPQASADFGRYQAAAPGNIEYDATGKSYVATRDFRPKFLSLSPERYLLQLQALQSGAIRQSDTWFDQMPTADVVPSIVRGPEAYTLRAIVRAIQMGGSIKVNYQSLTSTGIRTICPHALAHDGYRWHVRALSIERSEYRDYVLGRILSVSEPEICNADPSDDVEWRTMATLKLIAHPKLDKNEKETIGRDYKLKDGELAIETRLALAFYFIKRNNLDLRDDQISPKRAQLYLQNYDEIDIASALAKEESKILLEARRRSS
jgi:predicted DNA-binding transcriptional regulator YafY